MKRHDRIQFGSREIELEQPETLFVARRTDADSQRALHGATWSGRYFVAATEHEIPLDVWSEWRAAGWILVSEVPDPRVEDVEELALVAPIFRAPHGGWWIGTDRLIVRLSNELDDPGAGRLLERFDLSVVRRIRMKPHLYEVRSSKEPFEVAAKLRDISDVKYAEPQFVHSFGGRAGSR